MHSYEKLATKDAFMRLGLKKPSFLEILDQMQKDAIEIKKVKISADIALSDPKHPHMSTMTPFILLQRSLTSDQNIKLIDELKKLQPIRSSNSQIYGNFGMSLAFSFFYADGSYMHIGVIDQGAKGEFNYIYIAAEENDGDTNFQIRDWRSKETRNRKISG